MICQISKKTKRSQTAPLTHHVDKISDYCILFQFNLPERIKPKRATISRLLLFPCDKITSINFILIPSIPPCSVKMKKEEKRISVTTDKTDPATPSYTS